MGPFWGDRFVVESDGEREGILSAGLVVGGGRVGKPLSGCGAYARLEFDGV